MRMREAILWISQALPKKTILPIYNHISIRDGLAIASNGYITMSHPVNDSLVATPNGEMLVSAFKVCDDKTAISQLDNGNLVIKAKDFKVTIPSTTEPFPTLPSGGNIVSCPFPVRTALQAIRKFVSEDNARPIFRSICFKGTSLFASNNVSIVEYWTGVHTNFNFALPVDTVDAILSIPEEPVHFEISERWIRLHYGNGGWIHTSLMEEAWPNLEPYLQGDWVAVPPAPVGLWEAVKRVRPFLGDSTNVTIRDGKVVATAAEAEVLGLSGEAVYSHKHLAQLEGTALALRFGTPLRWVGHNIRGVTYGKLA